MASIAEWIEKIKTAIYGEEVRGAIWQSLEAMNTEVEAINVDEDQIEQNKQDIAGLKGKFQHDSGGTPISANTLPSGFYFGVLSAATSPNGSVTWWNVYTDASTTGTQTATLYTGRESYARARTGNSWSSWVKLPTRSEVDANTAAITALNSSTTLTLTRTEQEFVDATAFSRLTALKRGNMLYLNGNLSLSGGGSTPDFVRIGSISGWGAPSDIFAIVPFQGGGTSPLTVQITGSGIINIYGNNLSTGFYRFSACVPASA